MNEISHTPRFLGPSENSNEFPTGSKNFRNEFLPIVLIYLDNQNWRGNFFLARKQGTFLKLLLQNFYDLKRFENC